MSSTLVDRLTVRAWGRALPVLLVLPLSIEASASSDTGNPVVFEDWSESASLSFVHFNGMTGEFLFPEVFGAGAALLDYDNDGDLDVYLVQGNLLDPDKGPDDALFPPPGPLPLRDRLYRNELERLPNGEARLRFTDVTAESGIDGTEYGMGASAADFDNDGWVDLYVSNFGANRLWRNNGDGTFRDVTDVSGTGDRRWSVGASFVDVDRDGWLDLYVVNYVEFALYLHRPCTSESAARDYCGPLTYDPEPDRLFRNRGDGTFEDVSVKSGVSRGRGRGLGVVAADLDGDRWSDIYVANDDMPNLLWMNRRDGTFEDEGLLSGTAVNRKGQPEASMGIDAGDFDGDGDEDLFMSHLRQQTNTLYVNMGDGMFRDRSIEAGLASPSWPFTGFGTAWLDYDNDGWLDLLVVNGAIKTIESLARAGDPYPLHQTNQLFHNRGDGTFEEVTERAGEVFRRSEVSRGAAFGDLDNDGDTDVVVVNNSGPARLLINRIGETRHWLGLRLRGGEGERDLLGARVAVDVEDRPLLWRRARTDGSYASSNDPRVLVGLGPDPALRQVRVLWPDGTTEVWETLEPGAYTTLRPGAGKAVQGSVR